MFAKGPCFFSGRNVFFKKEYDGGHEYEKRLVLIDFVIY